MDRDFFRGAVAASGHTLKSLAFEMHMAESTMSRKIKTSSFTIAEAERIAKILGYDDPGLIFFTRKHT